LSLRPFLIIFFFKASLFNIELLLTSTRNLEMNRKALSIMVCFFWLSLMSACSKNLMPPEAGQLAGSPTSSEMAESVSSNSRGSAGKGFGITGEESSGFIREENVGESASSSTGSGTGGSGGSEGSNAFGFGKNQAEPFLGSPGSSQNQEEARKGNFKSTSLLRDIYFKFDKYDLDEESRAILRNNVDYLKANPSSKIEIQGHCDERGTNNYNIALGERRAQSTKIYMVSQGVSSRRIHTISYGEEKPFCFDSNKGCWSENRRAHFRISQ